ncbi:MAG: hypothetical protein BWY70_01003 [Bacteroidetes bacterium ADurb.Bin408]|nr:MAG: hypothetical protein BWY70_01003 [Bacteroidetes bacterium ADurb.Bin408]
MVALVAEVEIKITTVIGFGYDFWHTKIAITIRGKVFPLNKFILSCNVIIFLVISLGAGIFEGHTAFPVEQVKVVPILICFPADIADSGYPCGVISHRGFVIIKIFIV